MSSRSPRRAARVGTRRSASVHVHLRRVSRRCASRVLSRSRFADGSMATTRPRGLRPAARDGAAVGPQCDSHRAVPVEWLGRGDDSTRGGEGGARAGAGAAANAGSGRNTSGSGGGTPNRGRSRVRRGVIRLSQRARILVIARLFLEAGLTSLRQGYGGPALRAKAEALRYRIVKPPLPFPHCVWRKWTDA